MSEMCNVASMHDLVASFMYTPLSHLPPVSTSRPESISEEVFSSEVDKRRPVATTKAVSPEESEEAARKKRAAFLSLAQEMDRLAEQREQQMPAEGIDRTQHGLV